MFLKKLHMWLVNALEEPFFRAEMHKVNLLLPEKKELKLQLVYGSKYGTRKETFGIENKEKVC